MKIKVRSLCIIPLLLGACAGGPLDPTPGPHGLTVTATVSAVSLAEDCAAKSPPAGDSAGACAAGVQCNDLCQQSNVQIDLSADGGGKVPVAVQILRVRLFPSGSDSSLGDLSSREPEHWVAPSGYLSWNAQLAPSSTEKASWKLSAPDWATLQNGRLAAPQAVYRVEVSLSVDGQERTVVLDGVTREPLVST